MNIHLGQRVIRDWQIEDAPAIATFANNKNIWIQLRDRFPHPYDLTDAENFLFRVMQGDPRTIFAIATPEEAIGCISVEIGEDVHRFTAELGYWLAEPFWNQGIMSRAVTLFTDFAFKHFQLTRLFAEPYQDNAASAKVLEKAGFHLEGTLYGNAFKNGEVKDQLLYAKVRRTLRTSEE